VKKCLGKGFSVLAYEMSLREYHKKETTDDHPMKAIERLNLKSEAR